MESMTSSFSHRPEGYECPFCCIWGIDGSNQGTKQRDIIYQNEKVTAFIARKWWPNNKGHVLIIPNQHFENIFDLPADYAAEIHRAAQLTARAMKNTYDVMVSLHGNIMNLPAIKTYGIIICMSTLDMWMINCICHMELILIQKNVLFMLPSCVLGLRRIRNV